MEILHEPLKRGLAQRIHAALSTLGIDEQIDALYHSFGPTPKVEMGHLAFPCFKYAKALRVAPPQIAGQIAAAISTDDLIAEIRPAGPYLNFFFSHKALGEEVAAAILDGSMFRRMLSQANPRTMVEYSQPNTHKEIHVGHMRNMALGDSLIRCFRRANYDIVSTTFPGDVGTHVAKCLWYLKDINQSPVPSENKGAWLGNMYVQASQLLKSLEDEGKDTEAKARITEILKELESGSGPFYDLWVETREWSIALMKEVYEWADINFDVWYWESDVDSSSIAYARDLFKQGKLIESKGAIGMDLSAYDLGFAMMVKSDGTGLYMTKDIELARRKFEEHHIEKSIYIVDNRQSHHFEQVFKVLELLGFEQAKNCHHLAYEHVKGKEGTFSSRLGNAPPINVLISAMREEILKNYLQAQVDRGEMEMSEAEEIADIVTKGAIKYGMVRIDPAKIITFFLDEWISLEGDTGAYQQYTYARIQSLCRKQGFDESLNVDWKLLDEPREAELLIRLSELNDVVLKVVEQYRPNLLCAYLYNLAQLYNSVNNAIIIRDIVDPVLKNTRLALHKAVGETLRHGLSLLGIPVPSRM